MAVPQTSGAMQPAASVQERAVGTTNLSVVERLEPSTMVGSKFHEHPVNAALEGICAPLLPHQ
jgi:hypothetical protein